MTTNAGRVDLCREGTAPSSALSFPRATIAFFILVIVAILTTACSDQQSLTVAGASTLQPIIEDIGHDFEAENPKIRVDVMGGGTGLGIKAVINGRADLAMVARELSTQELSKLDVTWVATDAIAVITHTDTQLPQKLTVANLHALYAGTKITGLTRIRKQASHGTAAAFAKALGLKMADVHAELEAGSNAEVLTIVGHTPGAIGYVSHVDAERAIKAGEPIRLLRVDGVLPSLESIRSGHYPILRKLGLVKIKNAKDAAQYMRILMFLDFVQGDPTAKRRFFQHGFAAQ